MTYEWHLEKQKHNNLREDDMQIKLCQEAVDFIVSFLKGDIHRVLDIGCGEGYALERFYQHGIHRLDGIDILEDRIVKAREKNKNFGVGLENYETEEFYEPGRYDLIFCSHTFEHFWDWKKVLHKMINNVVDGGYIFLVFPLESETHVHSDAHATFFPTLREFLDALHNNNFDEEVKIVYAEEKKRNQLECWIILKKNGQIDSTNNQASA